jgi:hypothetical protein
MTKKTVDDDDDDDDLERARWRDVLISRSTQFLKQSKIIFALRINLYISCSVFLGTTQDIYVSVLETVRIEQTPDSSIQYVSRAL